MNPHVQPNSERRESKHLHGRAPGLGASPKLPGLDPARRGELRCTLRAKLGRTFHFTSTNFSGLVPSKTLPNPAHPRVEPSHRFTRQFYRFSQP